MFEKNYWKGIEEITLEIWTDHAGWLVDQTRMEKKNLTMHENE